MFSTIIVTFTTGFVCGTLLMTAIASWIKLVMDHWKAKVTQPSCYLVACLLVTKREQKG